MAKTQMRPDFIVPTPVLDADEALRRRAELSSLIIALEPRCDGEFPEFHGHRQNHLRASKDAVVRGLNATPPVVVAVSLAAGHQLSKVSQTGIRLLVGLGVEGDAHAGVTVKHRSRAARDPTQPNLRQVHLIHIELIEGLQDTGFEVGPGVMGENITTRGIDLLSLPRGARLRVGLKAVVEITGLRNPCRQLDDHQTGLTAAVLDRDAAGKLARKAGVMGIVVAGGDVRPGDAIIIDLPQEPHTPLAPV